MNELQDERSAYLEGALRGQVWWRLLGGCEGISDFGPCAAVGGGGAGGETCSGEPVDNDDVVAIVVVATVAAVSGGLAVTQDWIVLRAVSFHIGKVSLSIHRGSFRPKDYFCEGCQGWAKKAEVAEGQGTLVLVKAFFYYLNLIRNRQELPQ